jgi:diguanylate cyclase (GGDEF)-like protein
MALNRTATVSIQSQVLNAAFPVVAVVSVVLVLAVTSLTFWSLRSGLTHNAEIQAATLAEALASPLYIADREAVLAALERWRSANEIEQLVVYTASGAILAESPRAVDGAVSVPVGEMPADGVDVGIGDIRVVQPVSHQGERRGTVYLKLGIGHIYQQALIVAGAALLLAVLAWSAARQALKRVSSQIAQPLAKLAAVADAVAKSAEHSSRAGEEGPREVADLARNFNAMVDTLQQKVATLDQQLQDQSKAEAQLDYLAHYDEVTGLANRIQFHKELPRAAERAKRQGCNIAVVFLDLDDFKVVNDTLGHAVGDHLLRSVAERLTNGLRKGDFVCRFGGDEFTLILEGITSLRTAVHVVSKIIDTLAKVHDVDAHGLRIGVSAGIALYPVQTEDLGDLLRFADIAMYRAKGAGKNDYCVFTSELVSQANDRLSIESELRRGIQNDEFFLVYQPQVDIHSCRIVGLEALLRWQHPFHGLVSPDYFIDVAEKSGLIVPLGRQVIAIACRQWRAWQDQGIEPPQLAVNVSGRQLREENFADELLAAMATNGRPLPRLELEITESMLLSDTQVSKAMFHRLAALGIDWSLDDFGTGYSSLTYLAKFPIKNIKIDRSFIARVPGDENSEAIVKAIVAMAHGLGMRVITEGVETRQQVDYLAAMGGIVAQGYYYHRPLHASAVSELLRVQGADDASLKTLATPQA